MTTTHPMTAYLFGIALAVVAFGVGYGLVAWRKGVVAERDALAATVRQVGEWAMVNEIDEPPLDWRGLGDILRAAPSDSATSEPTP